MALVKTQQTAQLLAKLAFVWPALLLVATSGCQPHSPIEEYPKRLARVLKVTEPAPIKALALPPRSRRETAQAMEAVQLPVVDWWQLRSCELTPLLAQRNSSLGRVAAPSIRFNYEIKLLLALNQCLLELPQQQALLVPLIEHKQDQLRRLWQHLWVSEPSFSRHFTPVPGGFEGLEELTEWLNYLIKLQTSLLSDDLDALIQAVESFQTRQKAVELNSALSALWYHQLTVNKNLERANQVLSEADKVPCVNGQASSQARLMRDFFNGYYLAKIQPQLAVQLRELQRVQPLLEQLYPYWPKTLKMRYQALQQQTSLSQLKTQTKQHAQLWQHFLARCGLGQFH